MRLLMVERHNRKLRRGAHRGNRFRIVLRGTLPPIDDLDERLRAVAQQGVPNYFGEQRFGRNAGNLVLADDWSHGKRLTRHKRGLAISTIRSFLFNEFLDVRVRDGNWNKLIDGDVASLDGSRSVFPVRQVDDELLSRCEEMDLHPAGLLYGDGLSPSAIGSGREGWLNALSRARVKPAYRSLRLRVHDLHWAIQRDSIVLSFGLHRGAFATSVLREVADISSAN